MMIFRDHNLKSYFRSTNNCVFVLVVAAFIIRLIAVLIIPTNPVSDFWSLFTRASSIYQFGNYDAIAGRPDASFPPLYPLLLAAFFWLPIENLLVVKIINVILGAISVFIMIRVSQLIFEDKIAIIAGSLLAFYPRSVLMPLLVASENLFLPLLMIWIYFLIKLVNHDNVGISKLLYLGVLSGLLTLTRSVAYGLWVFLPLLTIARTKNLVHALYYAAILFVAHHFVLMPWAIRNYYVLGNFTFLNSTGGIGFFIGNNPGATGRFYQWQPDILSYDPQFFSKSIIAQNQTAAQIAWDWIITNPFAAGKLYLNKLLYLFVNERFVVDFAILYEAINPPWPAEPPVSLDNPIRRYGDILVAFVNSAYLGILLTQIVGIVQYLRDRWEVIALPNWSVLSLIASALYFPLISASFHAITRYRWPFTDLLLPFSALVIYLGYQKIRGWS